jgi:hypothetical protein
MKDYRPLYLAGIVLVFLFAVYYAFEGVDYGTQWDQNNIKGHVNKFVRTGNILPGEYIYPPGSAYIASTTVLPYTAPLLLRYGLNWAPTQRHLLSEVLNEPNLPFLLNLRRVFAFTTMLGILWTGLAASQRDRLAGLVAAAVLAFSWELIYHSRTVHPDGPTMQFVALAILLGMLAFYKRAPFKPQTWLALAAVAAAAATATKYTAGISLFIVLALAYGALQKENTFTGKQLTLRLAALALVFVLAFIALVPGVLMETQIFIQNLGRAQEIYATGHGLQTVNAGWDYLQRVLLYLFQAAFSYNRVLAGLIPTLALLGAYSLIAHREKGERWLALALAGVPLLYILFLITHRVLIIRNLLLIFPNIAILSGFGFRHLVNSLRSSALVWRLAPVAALLVLLGVNAQWIAHTAWTMQMRNSPIFADQALAAIAQRGDQRVYITPAALVLLEDRELPPNAVVQFTGDEDLVLFAYRGDTHDEEEGSWPINYPGSSPEIFGPREINFDWYAHWPGAERFVLADPQLAWQDGIRLRADMSPLNLSAAATQQISGLLLRDGDQFFVKIDDTRTIYLLNSANPKVIVALRPFVDSNISVTGLPYDESGNSQWYLLGVNGDAVLEIKELSIQLNFSRFFAQLSEQEKACLAEAYGDAIYRALTDLTISLVDLSDEDLQKAISCLEGG